MDVKQYFQHVRELALQLPSDVVVIKSLSTTNGGKAGVLTEVSRQSAAKQIIDGTAILATAEESASYYEDMEIKRQVAERAQALNRLQISLTTAAGPPQIEVRQAEPEEEE
jgi:hypothetical protein